MEPDEIGCKGDTLDVSGRKGRRRRGAIWQKKSYLAEKKLSGRKRVNLQKVLAAFQYEFSCVFSLAKLKYGKPRLGESTLT